MNLATANDSKLIYNFLMNNTLHYNSSNQALLTSNEPVLRSMIFENIIVCLMNIVEEEIADFLIIDNDKLSREEKTYYSVLVFNNMRFMKKCIQNLNMLFENNNSKFKFTSCFSNKDEQYALEMLLKKNYEIPVNDNEIIVEFELEVL